MEVEHADGIVGYLLQHTLGIALTMEALEDYQPHFGTAVTGIEIHHVDNTDNLPCPHSRPSS